MRPTSPSGLTVEWTAPGELSLGWGRVPDAVSYDVEYRVVRQTSSGGLRGSGWAAPSAGAAGVSVVFDGTGAVVSGLPQDGEDLWGYFARVRARNAHGVSDWHSGSVSEPTTPEPPTQVPEPVPPPTPEPPPAMSVPERPTGLVSSAVHDGVTLAWDDHSGQAVGVECGAAGQQRGQGLPVGLGIVGQGGEVERLGVLGVGLASDRVLDHAAVVLIPLEQVLAYPGHHQLVEPLGHPGGDGQKRVGPQ